MMRICFLGRPSTLLAIGIFLAGGCLLAGCKGDAQFSDKEIQQMKQGPPKEMPPQARAMFEKAMKAGTAQQGQPVAGQ